MLLKRSIYFLHSNIWQERGWNDLGLSFPPLFIEHTLTVVMPGFIKEHV
jgi:hypothetical protein